MSAQEHLSVISLDGISDIHTNGLVNVYSKHFAEALEKAKANGGVVVISNSESNNPRIIAVESNLSNLDYPDEDEGNLDSRDSAFELRDSDKPPGKRQKLEYATELPEDASLKDVLKNVHRVVSSRLDNMEKKMDSVMEQCQFLEEKVESIVNHLRESGIKVHNSKKFNFGPDTRSNISFVALNSESDFPEGSWLGDENNPEFRVRCKVSPEDLAHVNRNSHTPEKMALTLLDFLFDRETQACSNISGHGKHGKKQLDPLMIYGIKYHLIHNFNIDEKDWQRIKLNLDSKCRTAFRRKLKGMPLTVKAFRDKAMQTFMATNGGADDNDGTTQPDGDQVRLQCGVGVEDQASNYLNSVNLLRRSNPAAAVTAATTTMVDGRPLIVSKGPNDDIDIIDIDDKEALVDLMGNHARMELGLDVDSIAVGIDQQSQIIHTLQGDIQVVHATPEQLEEIQRTGKIQIISGNHFFQEVTDVLNLSTHSNADIGLASVSDGLILDDGQDNMAELKFPQLNAACEIKDETDNGCL